MLNEKTINILYKAVLVLSLIAFIFLLLSYFAIANLNDFKTFQITEKDNLTTNSLDNQQQQNVQKREAIYFKNTASLRPAADFRDFYGICWRGTAHENLAYAKQMGHDYVFYQKGMELDSLSNGLHFYFESPEYLLYERVINTNKVYTTEKINFYENYCALKNSYNPFPFNLATGWAWDPGSNLFTVLLDFQKKKVISFAINGIINYANTIQSRNPNFHFAGCAWDEPRPSGDFWGVRSGKRIAVKLDYWKSGNNNTLTNNTKPEFNDYTEGHIEFYKQLYKALRAKDKNIRFISEPYRIYEDWIEIVKSRPDAKEITPDILSQEGSGTQFTDDIRIQTAGLVKKENLYNTSPDVYSEQNNRIIASKAALNGAGFGWFGRFGGTGDMPDFKSIKEVPPRLKLIRLLANWENKNNTLLTARSWDGNTYQSKTAFVSSDVIAILQPKTKKLFVVFLTSSGSVLIPPNSKVSIFRTNDLFIEDEKATDDFNIELNEIKPKNEQCLQRGYIIKLNNK